MSFNVPLYHYDTTVVIFRVTAVLYPIAKKINTLLPIPFSYNFLPFLIQRLISPLVSMMMMINTDKYLLHYIRGMTTTTISARELVNLNKVSARINKYNTAPTTKT